MPQIPKLTKLKTLMNMKNISESNKLTQKRAYKKPSLKKFGSVAKITLKAGSQADAFGGTYAP